MVGRTEGKDEEKEEERTKRKEKKNKKEKKMLCFCTKKNRTNDQQQRKQNKKHKSEGDEPNGTQMAGGDERVPNRVNGEREEVEPLRDEDDVFRDLRIVRDPDLRIEFRTLVPGVSCQFFHKLTNDP